MTYAIPHPFAWDESFDVKNALLNEQHKQLFILINVLDADRSDKSKLQALLDLVLLHFKAEEDLFASHHFENAVAHKAIHDKFVTDAVGATASGVDENVMAFVKQWLVTHIKGSDMTYVGKI